MMSEKMRDGFESWCLANGYTLRPAETNCGIIIEGDYGHPTVQIAWQAWQASRAALCVNLPTNETTWPDGTELVDRKQVETSMDAAGVSYS